MSKKKKTLETGAQQSIEALLGTLAGKFDSTSRMGRQLHAERASLRKKGLLAYLLQTQDQLDYWRQEARALAEVRVVALWRLILEKACAALGVSSAADLFTRAVLFAETDVCELCECDLDALQRCFGCHERLCTLCNKSRTCYPMCQVCVGIWKPRLVHALFVSYLSLPAGQQTEENWALLQRRLTLEGLGS